VTIRDPTKAELDKVDDQYLAIVQRMIESLEGPSDQEGWTVEGWKEFLASCYGSMADAPIERGELGDLEIPGPLR